MTLERGVLVSYETILRWRAVDQHRTVLDALIQSRRHSNAAKRVFRKLLKGLHYAPWVIVTYKLGSKAITGVPESIGRR